MNSKQQEHFPFVNNLFYFVGNRDHLLDRVVWKLVKSHDYGIKFLCRCLWNIRDLRHLYGLIYSNQGYWLKIPIIPFETSW
jgi:hypothetical protein